MDTEDLLHHAADLADELDECFLREVVVSDGQEKIRRTLNHDHATRCGVLLTTILDFLERYSGSDSRWTKDARELAKDAYRGLAVAALLKQWVSEIRSGSLVPQAVSALGVREIASTDLMEQVRMLNEDKRVVPAAPIVLAGAALEIALRAAVEERSLEIEGTPGIDAYASALRRARILDQQDIKDVTQVAGLRNQAAHGSHDDLSRERAGLMEQQVNLFLRKLGEKLS